MEDLTPTQLSFLEDLEYKKDALNTVLVKMVSFLSSEQIKELQKMFENEPNKLPFEKLHRSGP